MTAPHPRMTRFGGDLRILRAAVFAAVCVVLGAAGHALASCSTVPLWTLGTGFLGVLLVAAPLAGRERSLPGIATLLALGQTVLHTLFGLGQHGPVAGTATTAARAATVGSMSSMPSTTSLSSMPSTTSLSSMPSTTSLTSLSDASLVDQAGTGVAHHPADVLSTAAGSSMALLPSLPMLLGHVLAAVAAGWLLRRGDMALLRLVELSAVSAHLVAEGALVRSLRGALALVRALRAGLPGTPAAGPRLLRTGLLAPPAPRTTALQHTVTRRGPPTAAALVLAA
ncbi:hypothetical protein [Streptomyces cellulosae]|uniref:hypothetical protein n=1 Tax=Streptomyces cellulosae TaxID=1968 RepID=UPI0004CAB223|nr:hypothetical protein [Streptomyces cellulosae]